MQPNRQATSFVTLSNLACLKISINCFVLVLIYSVNGHTLVDTSVRYPFGYSSND